MEHLRPVTRSLSPQRVATRPLTARTRPSADAKSPFGKRSRSPSAACKPSSCTPSHLANSSYRGAGAGWGSRLVERRRSSEQRRPHRRDRARPSRRHSRKCLPDNCISTDRNPHMLVRPERPCSSPDNSSQGTRMRRERAAGRARPCSCRSRLCCSRDAVRCRTRTRGSRSSMTFRPQEGRRGTQQYRRPRRRRRSRP